MSCVRFRRGSWGADYRDGFGRRRWKRFPSELAAAAFLEEWASSSSAARTVAEYGELWLTEARARVGSSTFERYEKEYRYNIAPKLGRRLLSEVTRFDLKRLVSANVASGRRPGMLVKVLSNLFGTAHEDGLIAAHPATHLSRLFRTSGEDTSAVKAFTREELARFLDEARSEPLYAELFWTMALSGVRLGEARALQAKDVRLDVSKLDVVRTFSRNRLSPTTKTKAARRIEIPHALAERLRPKVQGSSSDAWLFSSSSSPGGAEEFLRERGCLKAFQRIRIRAELARHLTSHCLRHTYASTLIAQGVPIAYVQRQLGHASIRQTVDVYGHWLEISRSAELERFAQGLGHGHGDETVSGESRGESGGCRLLLFSRRSARTAVGGGTGRGEQAVHRLDNPLPPEEPA